MSSVAWGDLRARELKELIVRDPVVIVPVGSIEQHGPHLPVQTDTLLVGEIARRAAEIATKRHPTLVMPTVWTGLAEHHMALGGTITLSFAPFLELLRGICQSLVRQGVRRILLLNGHGGNATALNVAVTELARTIDAATATATYWHVAAPAFAQILERQENVRHACEAETSMVLALRPELVDRDAMQSVQAPAEGLSLPGGVQRWRSIGHWSPSGVIGAPAAASADKGVRLLNAAAEAITELVFDEKLWRPA